MLLANYKDDLQRLLHIFNISEKRLNIVISSEKMHDNIGGIPAMPIGIGGIIQQVISFK